jgi:hypothetical protein
MGSPQPISLHILTEEKRISFGLRNISLEEDNEDCYCTQSNYKRWTKNSVRIGPYLYIIGEKNVHNIYTVQFAIDPEEAYHLMQKQKYLTENYKNIPTYLLTSCTI